MQGWKNYSIVIHAKRKGSPKTPVIVRAAVIGRSHQRAHSLTTTRIPPNHLSQDKKLFRPARIEPAYHGAQEGRTEAERLTHQRDKPGSCRPATSKSSTACSAAW